MIKREQMLEFLRIKQESNGGYAGTDLTDLAEILGVTPWTFRLMIFVMLRNDQIT